MFQAYLKQLWSHRRGEVIHIRGRNCWASRVSSPLRSRLYQHRLSLEAITASSNREGRQFSPRFRGLRTSLRQAPACPAHLHYHLVRIERQRESTRAHYLNLDPLVMGATGGGNAPAIVESADDDCQQSEQFICRLQA